MLVNEFITWVVALLTPSPAGVGGGVHWGDPHFPPTSPPSPPPRIQINRPRNPFENEPDWPGRPRACVRDGELDGALALSAPYLHAVREQISLTADGRQEAGAPVHAAG